MVLSADRASLTRLARYIAVGLASTGTYFVVFAGLIEAFGTAVWLAASAAFMAGTVVSYLGNALWTFGQKTSAQSAVRFMSVIGTTFLVNLAIAAGLAAVATPYPVIFAVEVVVLTTLNFIGHTLWSFRTA